MDFYEAQSHAALNTPGLSIEDGRYVDRWLDETRTSEAQRVKSGVRKKRENNRFKIAEASERVSSLQDELVHVRRQAERNEVPYSELAKAQRQARAARLNLELVYESLTASEAGAAAMEADPLAYLQSWYAHFPALQDRRPNLTSDLDENRRKRGARLPK